MNYLLTSICSLLVLSIAFYACRKGQTDEPTPTLQTVTLKEAQMIYGYAAEELKIRFGDKYTFLSPHWGNVQATSFGLRHNALYVSLGFNDSTGDYLQMLIMKDEGRLRSLLIEIQPDKNWIVNHRNLSKYDELSGKLIFYSINGRFHQGYLMKNGAMVNEYTPEKELHNPSTLLRLNQISSSGSGVTTEGDACQYGTFGCQELSEVKIVLGKKSSQTNYVYIYIPSTVYNSSSTGGNYSGYTWYPSGGSVSSSPKTNLPFGIITNEMSNSCLNSTYNQLTTSYGAVTDIGWILQSVFGVSSAVDLYLRESTTLSSNVDGVTYPGDGVAVIRLNVNTLPSASREYVAATIYHEIIHAALEKAGHLSELDSHTKMVGYIGKMAMTLRALYPSLSSDEATALCWGGLQDTQAWATQVNNNPSYANYVQAINATHKIRANGAGSACQ